MRLLLPLILFGPLPPVEENPDALRLYAPRMRSKVDKTTAHRDHIHIGMTKPGAKATSFWLARGDGILP
jgi:hypothetical protein